MNKKNTLLSLIVALTLFACTGNSQSSTDIPDAGGEDIPSDSSTIPDIPYATSIIEEISPPTFSLYSENPVLEKGDGWDNFIIYPASIIFHDGLFHMLYFGTTDQENQSPFDNIGYAVSEDGYEWVRASEKPISFSDELEYDLVGISDSFLLISQDNIWIMYFTGGSSTGLGTSFIGRATAPEITGPWTFDDAPLLLPGDARGWDGGGIRNPQVFKTQTGYMMFFTGRHGNPRLNGRGQIGLATSPDGVTWTKYKDPVFKVGGEFAWDSKSVKLGAILQTQNGWAMLYFGTVEKDMRTFENLGFATSLDGINWERYTGNPVFFTAEDAMPGFHFGDIDWIFHDNTHFLYFGAFNRSLITQEIYLATSD